MLVPIGRLEIFVSFMKAARKQVGRKQVAKRLRCGGGQGGRAERTLGGGAKEAAQVAKGEAGTGVGSVSHTTPP